MLVFRVSNLYSDRVQVMQILFSVLDNSDGDKTLANNLAGYSKCVPVYVLLNEPTQKTKRTKRKRNGLVIGLSLSLFTVCLFFPLEICACKRHFNKCK